MGSSLYQISLVAAFGAGMVALFAPCCISFLLPSYFGNIFKERRRVLGMTLVYSVGIFTVMLPIVLGAKALALFFFRFHDQSYVAGGIFLLVVAAMTWLGIKLPVPHLSLARKGSEIDIWSTYTLGLFAGITSACCAPVLLGVMGLSAFSVTLVGSVGVGVAYVLGMVFPLYIASWFLDRGNFLAKPVWRKRWRGVLLADMVGAAIFGALGIATVYLALTGKLGMPAADPRIGQTAEWLTGVTRGIPLVNVAFVVAMGVILGKLIERAIGRR